MQCTKMGSGLDEFYDLHLDLTSVTFMYEYCDAYLELISE